MRTTVELDDKHRALLLKLSAEKGQKGFSKIISKALDYYFKNVLEGKQDIAEKLDKLFGSISAKEADKLEETVSSLRSSWR